MRQFARMSAIPLILPLIPRAGEWHSKCPNACMKTKITFALLGMAAVCLLRSAAQSPPLPQPTEQTHLISSLGGSDLYQAYCAVCHGKNAKGDGPMARSLKATPADLTLIAMRNGGRFPRQRVEGILVGEVAVETGHGTREMPLWGPIFSQIAWDQDLGRVRIDNLAKYLEQLQAK
jgi:hypothetical protein